MAYQLSPPNRFPALERELVEQEGELIEENSSAIFASDTNVIFYLSVWSAH